MINVLATNITSPIGGTSRENYLAVRDGVSALRQVDGWNGYPCQICVSQFSDEQRRDLLLDGCTWFESLAVTSVREALSHTDVDLSSPRVVFILSTTKCNVDELASYKESDGNYLSPGQTALKIASILGITTTPLVVCNACISGVAAQVVAERLISAGDYDVAVVCGADTMSSFTVAGFTSFKALSPCECRPFDIERQGLNLGEGAATMILGKVEQSESEGSGWHIVSDYLNNDAYHVSAPVPDGNGVKRAIMHTVEGCDTGSLATVCAHGTATMFNDQMESRAIQDSGLGTVPVTAFKGTFGHTLGAAGLLESIISMLSIDDGKLIPVRGFEEIGVSGRIRVNDSLTHTDRQSFLKIISGFGGCNGAILYSKSMPAATKCPDSGNYSVAGTLTITPDSLTINDESIPVMATGQALLTEIYKSYIADCPKFYKMDPFSRLAFVASCLLFRDWQGRFDPESVSVLLFNGASSVLADRQHLGTFIPPSGFYPSPSTFLYTLPNVVMGEIAVRLGVKGETTFIILPQKDDEVMGMLVKDTLATAAPSAMICGWVDCPEGDSFTAELKLLKHI